MTNYRYPFDPELVSYLLRAVSGKTLLGVFKEEIILPDKLDWIQRPNAPGGFRIMGLTEGPDIHTARMHHVPDRTIRRYEVPKGDFMMTYDWTKGEFSTEMRGAAASLLFMRKARFSFVYLKSDLLFLV